MRRRKKNTKHGSVVARLAGVNSKARQALAGDSNDAEHDALYEVEATLKTLTPDVRRMVDALKLCMKLLQRGNVRSGAGRHRYSLWRAALSSARAALGHAQDGRVP